MRKALLPLIAALAVTATGLAILTSPGTTDAHRDKCPKSHLSAGSSLSAANSTDHDDDDSDDGGEQHDKKDKKGKKDKHKKCQGEHPTPTPRMKKTPHPTPAVTPTPTAPGEPTAPPPSATPTQAPTPIPAPSATPSPTPAGGADVKVVSVAVSAPASATAGIAFLVVGMTGLHNNGPDGPVNVDTRLDLHLPPDCTVTNPTTVVIPDRSAPASVAVSVSRAWNVTCIQTGAHQFTIDASLVISPGQAFSDPNPSNNNGSGSASTQVN